LPQFPDGWEVIRRKFIVGCRYIEKIVETGLIHDNNRDVQFLELFERQDITVVVRKLGG
jgi:hypothetical protein